MSAPSAVQTPSRPKMDTKTMVSIAMLTGIAYIVMLLSKLMPSVMFLDFDFKDVVVCIGGFTFGPFAAAIISILVAFIEMLTISHTGPIGFIMNVLATCAFSCTACFIYKKVHSKKGAVLGLACGGQPPHLQPEKCFPRRTCRRGKQIKTGFAPAGANSARLFSQAGKRRTARRSAVFPYNGDATGPGAPRRQQHWPPPRSGSPPPGPWGCTR